MVTRKLAIAATLLAGAATLSVVSPSVASAATTTRSAVLMSSGELCAANQQCLIAGGSLIVSTPRHFIRGNEGKWQVWRVGFVSLKTIDPRNTKRSWIVKRSGDPIVIIRSVARPSECAGFSGLLVVPGNCSTFAWIIADGTLYGGFTFGGQGTGSNGSSNPYALTAVRGGSGLVILQPFTHSADQDW